MENRMVPFGDGGSPFDRIKQVRADGSEFWSARDLHPLLGYDRWERFPDVIDRAKAACKNSGVEVSDHFRPSSKMVPLGSGSMRGLDDYELTRYACYLVAMNGDPRKPEIAAAQTYFAIQTHRQEMADQDREIALLKARAELLREQRLMSIQEKTAEKQRMAMAVLSSVADRIAPSLLLPVVSGVLGVAVPTARPLTITEVADKFREEKGIDLSPNMLGRLVNNTDMMDGIDEDNGVLENDYILMSVTSAPKNGKIVTQRLFKPEGQTRLLEEARRHLEERAKKSSLRRVK